MQAYVINLARSPERRAHMVRELDKAGLQYDFVEAVEGRDLDLSDAGLVDQAWVREGPYWAGAVGCYLSHLKVHEKVLETDAERTLVLEDDVLLPADTIALIEAAAAQMTGAEAVLLHHHRFGDPEGRGAYGFLRRDSVQLPGSRLLAFPASVADVGATGAYLITREACQRMAEAMLPVRTFVDNWGYFRTEGVLDRVRCIVPMPVQISPAFRTTIEHYGPSTLQTRLRETAIRIPLLSHALTIRRQRIMARNTAVELVDDL